MNSISENVYIDKLDEIVNKYNMKPIDIKDNTYINTEKEVNNKDPKLQVGDHVRISKYKSFSLKAIVQVFCD